ncbi:hypothetical protein V2G26_002119 [Clonostachys chloroleuca]
MIHSRKSMHSVQDDIVDAEMSTSLRPHDQGPTSGVIKHDGYQTSPLLQLPVELLFMVLDILRPHEKSILGQTCRSLSEITCGKSLATYDLPDDEAFDYLRCISHNNPGKWVCAYCAQLHTVTDADLREEWWDCFAYKYGKHESFVPLWDSKFCSDGYRHVQLSLKYDRLSPNSGECRERLRRLLTPYNDTPTFPERKNAMRGHLHAAPKVAEGRFILKSTWTFDTGDTILSPTIMGNNVPICIHHGFGKSCHVPKTLKNAIGMAFEYQGITVHGSCGSCPTDFTVKFRNASVAEVSAWKDFGGEGSPLSDTWRANLYPCLRLHLGNKRRGGSEVCMKERPPERIFWS